MMEAASSLDFWYCVPVMVVFDFCEGVSPSNGERGCGVYDNTPPERLWPGSFLETCRADCPEPWRSETCKVAVGELEKVGKV